MLHHWDIHRCIFFLFCYHHFVLLLRICSHRAFHVCVFRCSTSPLCACWVYAPLAFEYACYFVRVCSLRTSRVRQSCESSVFCKAETFCSQKTTKLTQRCRNTESEGYNTPSPSLFSLLGLCRTVLLGHNIPIILF